MNAIRLDMTMSPDGFCAGPDDRPGQEMGRNGSRLFNWLDHRHDPGPDHDVYADPQRVRSLLMAPVRGR